MALNPAFATATSRRLPLAFGYVQGVGDRLLSTVTVPTTLVPVAQQTALYLLGEGEWDGPEMLAIDAQSHLSCGLIGSTKATFLAGFDVSVHFHSGAYTVKGAGNQMTSIGYDQQYDEFFENFPSVAPPQSFSGIAYAIFNVPMTITAPGDVNTVLTGFPLAPAGIWRSTRCRTFDANGNVLSYGFTTNPAWHFVEAILRYKIKPQQPALAGLLPAEKACFNWPSIVENAARNDFLLPNGRPRFVGNYVFASDATLTNILETILRVSRSFQRISGNQIYLIGDDTRASVFLMGANNVVPGSLKLAKKDIAKAPNVFVPRYRDIDIPAVCRVASVSTAAASGGAINQRTFKLLGLSPFLAGDYAQYGGSSVPGYDGNYDVVEPIGAGGVSGVSGYIPNQVLTNSPSPNVGPLTANGGFLGTNDARFSERAPTNVVHRSAQKMVPLQAPGLGVQPRVIPVEYDCGSSTFDQTNRLMKFERDRTLGTDIGVGWTAPVSGSLTGWDEAVDVNGNALTGVEVHDVITLDDWVTAEFPGDYEVMEISRTAPSSGQLGQITLQLMQYNPNAPTDVSDDPGLSYTTVPSVDLPLGTFPLTNAAWVLQATPVGTINPATGLLTITASDLSVQWQGNLAPTLYPTAQWVGLTQGKPYVLFLTDAAHNGVAPTFGFVAGTLPLLPEAAGKIPILSNVFYPNNSTNIDLVDGTATFFSGTGADSQTFNFPSGPGAELANLIAWSSPQGFTLAGSAHLHYIQESVVDPNGLLHLIYNDGSGTTWNGPINYAGVTWNSVSALISYIGVAQFVTLTLAGGEEICFGQGIVGPGGMIVLPAGFTLANSILCAFPFSATDSGQPTLGVRAYVSATGVVNDDYNNGSGTAWTGESQMFVFAWKNNMGTVSVADGWVKIPLSTGKTLCLGGFSILDHRRAGVKPTNYPTTENLTQVLTGGNLPLPAGFSASTLQVMPGPDSYDYSNPSNPAHGVNQCLVDASQNVFTSFADGSGNEWYGSSSVFALLCDVTPP